MKSAGTYFDAGDAISFREKLKNNIARKSAVKGRKALAKSKEFDINSTVKKLEKVWKDVRNSRI